MKDGPTPAGLPSRPWAPARDIAGTPRLPARTREMCRAGAPRRSNAAYATEAEPCCSPPTACPPGCEEKGPGHSLAPTRMSNNPRFDDRCRSARLGDVGEDHRRCCTDSVPVHLCQVDEQLGHFKHVRPRSDFDFRGPRGAPYIRMTKSMDPVDSKKVTREGGTHRESRTSGSHITILAPCSPTVAETVG